MTFSVDVAENNNLIRKHVAFFDVTFPSLNLTEIGVNLAPQAAYTVGPVDAICINTSDPLQATLAIGTELITVTINQVLMLDSGYDTVTLVNPALAGTPPVKVFLAYTSG